MIADLRYYANTIEARIPYNAELIADLKVVIPSHARRWNPASKVWEIGRSWEEDLRDLLHQYNIDVRGEGETPPPRSAPAGDDAWAVLWLRPDAPLAVVDAVYRCLCKLHHPDLKAEGEKTIATVQMARINRAVEKIRAEVR